MSLGVMEL